MKVSDSVRYSANSADLYDIAVSISRRLLQARVNVRDAKEKFGTVRVYCTFGWYTLHDVVYPGYHFNQFPRWAQLLDNTVTQTIVQYASRWVEPYQRRVYRQAYKDAVEKYPQYRTAILSLADWPELLEGL